MKFEVHITGEKGINEELDALSIKNIVVELLHPDLSVYRTEYMSSFVIDKPTYQDCKDYVDYIVNQLKSKIIRVKIECPFDVKLIERSLYIEAHFDHKYNLTLPIPYYLYPLSRNAKSGRVMGTSREYDKSLFEEFRD
jgi:hypothetical protein